MFKLGWWSGLWVRPASSLTGRRICCCWAGWSVGFSTRCKAANRCWWSDAMRSWSGWDRVAAVAAASNRKVQQLSNGVSPCVVPTIHQVRFHLETYIRAFRSQFVDRCTPSMDRTSINAPKCILQRMSGFSAKSRHTTNPIVTKFI